MHIQSMNTPIEVSVSPKNIDNEDITYLIWDAPVCEQELVKPRILPEYPVSRLMFLVFSNRSLLGFK